MAALYFLTVLGPGPGRALSDKMIDSLPLMVNVTAVELPHEKKHVAYDCHEVIEDRTRPCDSPQSLANFFNMMVVQTNSTNIQKFSKYNPVCPTAAYHRMHVLIPFYNLDQVVILKAIQSVRKQDYPKDKVTIWVYDDGSVKDKNHLNKVCNIGCGSSNILEFNILNATNKTMEYLWGINGENVPSLICIHASDHLGPGGAKYNLFALVRTLALPNEIVMILDGDDELNDDQALQIVNQKYIDTNVWFTYGSFEGKWSEQTQDIPPEIRNGTRKFLPRDTNWLYGHPRTFKAHLLQHITQSDFKFKDGTWLLKATDCGFVYRMLELSGPSRIGFISKKIYKYKYKYSDLTSTLAITPLPVRNAHIQHTKKDMKPSNELKLPVHVVLLSWKRYDLLKYQLEWLEDQDVFKTNMIHLHLVNNNWMEKKLVKQVVLNFTQSRSAGKTNRMKVTLVHANKERLYHNFARFVYVDILRRTTALDFVIFLDDDQYWAPDFVSSLLQGHKPKGMTTWYGKNFDREKGGNYWKPTMDWDDIAKGHMWPLLDHFKYGGSGGSIIDTNLWLMHNQLMRLSEDLISWCKIDDLWASYVMDALLGWDIRRLAPPSMPIDIGCFGLGGIYYQNKRRRLGKSMTSHLLLLSSRVRIMNVSTYLDPSVNKQDTFHKLQTSFYWDIYDKQEEASAANDVIAIDLAPKQLYLGSSMGAKNSHNISQFENDDLEVEEKLM